MSMTLRYARPALFADYARATAGVAICGLPLTTVASNGITVSLAGVGVMFLLFGARTALRHATEIVADESGITARGPFGGTIAWNKLARLKLAYYATRRDRKGGWMHMTLAGEGRTIRLDSSLDGFDQVARLAARAGVTNGLDVSAATRANLAAMNIAFPVFEAESPA
ncbi:MAG: hypothetical protein KIT36_14805 [Alphaproteobacteria bacterium]|nr:hypothetical protein [Alphaproteobacteria bacterium]